MGNEKYGSNRKYSGIQLAKISELRKKLDMGDASQEEVAKEAKRLGVKGFKDGGPAAPIMPEKAKKIRKHRSTRNDKTSVSKEMRDYIKEQDAKNMEKGGEAVPAKFKGFSKLPEGVQRKMDPGLAQKYEAGGAVGSCRGMGSALRGGKFSGVK